VKRREFIAGLGGTAMWPLAVLAQQPPVQVIGYLTAGDARRPAPAFHKGLGEMGFVEGKNVAIEFRSAEFRYDRLPVIAAELVRRRVAVIYSTGGSIVASAAKVATKTIPIVFLMGDDPLIGGVVASLNRPGGNVTGFYFMGSELTAKRLGLLRELLPAARRFAVLVNPGDPSSVSMAADAQAAALTIGRQIEVFPASNEREIDEAFAGILKKQSDALLIGWSVLFTNRAAQISTLAARHALPTMHYARRFVETGGLISYGSSIDDTVRQSGNYVGRILRGEKPADLPVVQPTNFELVINLTTARALGVAIPERLLATADEVIQ
jgi:putative tryptophan/tyrosine transport system substrate-binding protein